KQWLAMRGFHIDKETTPAILPVSLETSKSTRRTSPKSTTLNSPEAAKCTEIPTDKPLPGPIVELQAPKPLSAFNDDPVFGTVDAAEFLGLDTENLKKWRQRGQGPDYLQYGPGGPVFYTLGGL